MKIATQFRSKERLERLKAGAQPLPKLPKLTRTAAGRLSLRPKPAVPQVSFEPNTMTLFLIPHFHTHCKDTYLRISPLSPLKDKHAQHMGSPPLQVFSVLQFAAESLYVSMLFVLLVCRA